MTGGKTKPAFEIKTSSIGWTIAELRDEDGRLHRFTLCKMSGDIPEFFIMANPPQVEFEGEIGSAQHMRILLATKLSSEQIDAVLNGARQNPLPPPFWSPASPH
jgi:hypothetical protein